MKLFETVSLTLILIFLVCQPAQAQIKTYAVEVTLEEKNPVRIVITFVEPVESFEMNFEGRIENFNATSTAGPVRCEVKSAELSTIACKLKLTEERKTIELTFLAPQLVSRVDGKLYFSGDFTLRKNVDEAFVAVRLPEGYALTQNEKIFPEGGKVTSDGRRIIIIWRYENVDPTQPLKFSFFFEALSPALPLQLLGLPAALVLAALLVLFSRLRRPEEIVLSVLDEVERKVLELVQKAGSLNQKRIVQETGLSKAKVSRVVKFLEQRGLLSVERRGRTNILKIRRLPKEM